MMIYFNGDGQMPLSYKALVYFVVSQITIFAATFFGFWSVVYILLYFTHAARKFA